MENATVFTVANTSATGSVEEFINSQDIMKNPMVIVLNKDTNKGIEHFKIIAEDYEEFELMCEYKIFYTSSVPKGETKHAYGGIFYGVENDRHKKTRSAATERAIN